MTQVRPRFEHGKRLFRLSVAAMVVAGLGYVTPGWAQSADESVKAYDYPSWSDFPPPPTDIPTPADIKHEVLAIENSAARLQDTVAKIVWELSNPDAFSRTVTARVDPILGAPIATPLANAEVEAFAEILRRKAKAPPIEQ